MGLIKSKFNDLHGGEDNEFRAGPRVQARSKWPIGILEENRRKDEKADDE